jgi:hypothetical protein
MDPNTIGVWRLSGALPMPKKLRMRLGLVLYVIGLERLGVRVGRLPREHLGVAWKSVPDGSRSHRARQHIQIEHPPPKGKAG